MTARWLQLRTALLGLLSLTLLGACAATGTPPLEAMDRKLDLERFMGDWYVIGFIPSPFRSSARRTPTTQSSRTDSATTA